MANPQQAVLRASLPGCPNPVGELFASLPPFPLVTGEQHGFPRSSSALCSKNVTADDCELPSHTHTSQVWLLEASWRVGVAPQSDLHSFTDSHSPMPRRAPHTTASSWSSWPLLFLVSVGTGSGTARTTCVTPPALPLAWHTTSPLTGSNTCSLGSASTFWCR